MILTSFVILSITTISDRHASVMMSRWFIKSFRTSYSLFSVTLWLMLLPLWCYIRPMFFTSSPMSISKQIDMPLLCSFGTNILYLPCFLLSKIDIGVIKQSYLYVISHNLFSEFVLEHSRLKPQWTLSDCFSTGISVC